MNKLRMVNILGELEKEVTCLQVVFWGDYHTNMDASHHTEEDKWIARKALENISHKVFFVKPGGLGINARPSCLPAELKVSYPKLTAQSKEV